LGTVEKKVEMRHAFEAVPEEFKCAANREVKVLRHGIKLTWRRSLAKLADVGYQVWTERAMNWRFGFIHFSAPRTRNHQQVGKHLSFLLG
jgi:hypothetical protein